MGEKFHEDWLSDLESETAAVFRQYGRAAQAGDRMALRVEAAAICDRVRWLFYHHLGLRVGMSSDDWVWLNGEEYTRVEQTSPTELRASGRMWCSLPDGHRQWTEPFTAYLVHSAASQALSAYTIRLGSRRTLLRMAATRQRIECGEVPKPSPPARDNGWAFVFHLGDRA